MLKALSLILFLLINFRVIAQFTVWGTVADSISGNPLPEVKAEILPGSLQFSTDQNGKFRFVFYKAGFYILLFTVENYHQKTFTLNFNDSSGSKEISVKLRPQGAVTDTIDVNAILFKKERDVSTSYINTQYNEIRKNPGTFEDVVKYYSGAPGVLAGNDQNNHLLVRGGSSFENQIVIDGFEIPNPNHYGPPGSSNGALSYINSRLIGDVDFYTGGFPARYGDKISSVMEINFREGSRKKHIRDINLSVTGFGGFFEGPVSKRSSYMVAVRKSYFELVKDKLGSDLLPSYWDFNGKLNYNFSKNEKLSLTGLYVIDHAEAYKTGTGNEQDTVDMNLLNLSLKYSSNNNVTKSSTVIGYSSSFYEANYSIYNLNIKDRYFSLSQNLSFNINNYLTADFSAGLKYYFSDFYIRGNAWFNESGYLTPQLWTNTDVNTYKAFGGINFTTELFNRRLKVNTGLRIDMFSYMNKPYSFSPRLGILYRLWANTSLKLNAGYYYQSPDLTWLVVYPQNRDLYYIKCGEIVAGAEHYIGKDLKISAEGYLKQYYDYPVSVYDPNFIFINNGVNLHPNFLDKAVSAGRGYYTGIDIIAESKNNGYGLYWSAGYSFSYSKFLALVGDYQPAEFDPGHQVNLIAGFKFKWGLSISGHFKYAGGRPYTPFDMEKSYYYQRGVYIENQYNKARMPEYIRMDIRIEQNIKPWNSDVILYFEVLNLFNRRNIYRYGWDYGANTPKDYIHFYRIAVVGASWKF